MKTKYRFRVIWRQYRPGDPVPDTFGGGVVASLLQSQRIEAAPAEAKAAAAKPASRPARNRVPQAT